jgi:hypothetical protein
MTGQLFFAITLIGTAVLLNSAAEAATGLQCEDRAANCLGTCADRTAGAGDLGGRQSKCLLTCDRRVTRCYSRATGR